MVDVVRDCTVGNSFAPVRKVPAQSIQRQEHEESSLHVVIWPKDIVASLTKRFTDILVEPIARGETPNNDNVLKKRKGSV